MLEGIAEHQQRDPEPEEFCTEALIDHGDLVDHQQRATTSTENGGGSPITGTPMRGPPAASFDPASELYGKY